MKDHFFNNIVCGIDTETTGRNPDVHEIAQLALIPLGYDLKPHPYYSSLDIWMCPENLDDVEPESLTITGVTLDKLKQGMSQGTAADLFHSWFNKLHLPPNARLIPLAHNWLFDSQFVRNWLSRQTFDLIFHGHFRDTMLMGNALNDLAWAYDKPIPYPRLGLREMCNSARIEVPYGPHSAMIDAGLTVELYRHLCFNRQLTRSQEDYDS